MKNAYAAGLIDGEGSISLLKARKNETFRHPVIEISNTTYELLQFMKTTFGGSISSHKTYKKHYKPSWSWKLHYDAAISCLEQITPFLLESSLNYEISILNLFAYSLKLKISNWKDWYHVNKSF